MRPPRHLNFSTLGGNLFLTHSGHLLPIENYGPRFGGANSHLKCFTLDCKPHQCELEVMARWHQQNHIICGKQRRDTETTEPEKKERKLLVKAANSSPNLSTPRLHLDSFDPMYTLMFLWRESLPIFNIVQHKNHFRPVGENEKKQH